MGDCSGQRYRLRGQAFTGEFGAPPNVTTLANGQRTFRARVWDVEPAGSHGKVVLVDGV